MNTARQTIGYISISVLLLGMLTASIAMILIPVKTSEFTGEISVYNIYDNKNRIESRDTYKQRDGDAVGVDVGRATYKRSVILGICCLLMTVSSGYLVWKQFKGKDRG